MSTARRFEDTAIHVDVKDYYGKKLQKQTDLKSNACLAPSQPTPTHVLKALKKVHADVTDRYYGCGLVVPECLEGCSILDLGSGSGRDCYMLSQLVGQSGHVTGIDMTEEQLAVARAHIDHHMKEFGFKNPNVSFVQGYIEALSEAGLQKNSFDIIISNCVVNLSPDKKRVLAEAYNVLKDGGEFYFSDVYSSDRLTEDIKQHKVLWGDYKFVSVTYRLFKTPKGSPEPRQVMYNGNITGVEGAFQFDSQYTFKVNEVVEVDGEVASILSHSRFAGEFTFQPQGGTSGPCAVRPQPAVVDPFQLVLQRGEKGSAAGGCCSAKSATCCK
ncbi:arsenite methyltransferase-like isoform X2 [Synchiropus splendidus]|uniref:arsenite methyltransferase-like isoform X2 n=1 Tax=Synchiropus splendidus TaxID=270530 RepID=UPI00237E5CEE|nr:arsenite methyltransferase-like isoform X2 [Synchiropus splendidus]